MKRCKTNSNERTIRAFTLVEILMVVCILGITAAIVVPQFSKSSVKAREAAAKKMLQTLRGQIELYTHQHNGFPPGFVNGYENAPLGVYMVMQFRHYTNIRSQWETTKSAEYCYGPYLKQFPVNPFNERWDTYVLKTDPGDGDWPAASETYGWLYYPNTKSIRLNTFGKDSDEKSFQSY